MKIFFFFLSLSPLSLSLSLCLSLSLSLNNSDIKSLRKVNEVAKRRNVDTVQYNRVAESAVQWLSHWFLSVTSRS